MGFPVRIWARQLRRVLKTRDFRVGLAIVGVGAAVVVSLLLLFPELAPSIGIDLVLTFIAAVAGVHLSHALIFRRIFKTDTDRIASPRAVCERYGGAVDLLETSRLASIDGAYGGALPLVRHDGDLFEGVDPSFPAERSASVYEIPPSVSAFLEPRHDELVSRFNDEGKPNRRLVRLDSVRGATAHVSESSYFRTYCTNLSPDFTGGRDRLSLRDAFDRELVTDSGLVPLESSPFSNALSGGGLVVTTGGATIVGVRTFDATVSERELVDSFGGNLPSHRFEAGGVRAALLHELDDEIAPVAGDDVRAFYGLGLVRRMDWFGQPNLHAVVLVDAPAELTHSGTEHLDTLSIDLGERVTADSLSDPAFARDLVSAVLEACDGSNYTPGVTLLTTLELWLRQVESDASRPAADRGDGR